MFYAVCRVLVHFNDMYTVDLFPGSLFSCGRQSTILIRLRVMHLTRYANLVSPHSTYNIECCLESALSEIKQYKRTHFVYFLFPITPYLSMYTLCVLEVFYYLFIYSFEQNVQQRCTAFFHVHNTDSCIM